MSLIQMKNVGKSYGSEQSLTTVMSEVNLSIAEGEFVALMGPSGSGKSTLLTVLGAMNRPTVGTVHIDGLDVYSLSDAKLADFRREYLGFVFQQHHLMPYLSTVENVMLPLAPIRKTTRQKRQKALELLDRVGLADKAKRLPNQLSGGEQGRVAIARALVNDPPLLLADEPTGTLDTQTGENIMRLFRQLNLGGQTIFMVTHNPENAREAHRSLFIRDGRLECPCEEPHSATATNTISYTAAKESHV
ncbi:MAG TPA: ABC transporter ATP-binding protein [Clostridia bacterium]|nr:ABC transporter ATP-binding protein [Clostridia bacterium]